MKMHCFICLIMSLLPVVGISATDLVARVREELRFPRDPQDEFRLPNLELIKEIRDSQDTNEVAQIKAYVYDQFINFDPYALIDRFEPYTMSFKIGAVCGWFSSICKVMPREIPLSSDQCITVAKLADRYQPPELPPPQCEVESKIIRMNYALRGYQASVKQALEPCMDALQRQLPKDEFAQLSNEVVRLTRMTSKREKDFFKRIVVRERSERAERERKRLRLPHYIVQPDGTLRRDPDDLKYPPEAFIHQ